MTLADFLASSLAEGAVIVRIAEAQGSTPREAGATMIVSARGSAGTIGGGQLEFHCIDLARILLDSGGPQQLVEIPLGPQMGQCCGGRVRDCFQLVGDALRDRASPMGRWQVMASYLILGPSSRLPSQADLQSSHVEGGSIIGVSALPNAAGWGIRCLAADAIAARKASDRLFSLCCEAAFGHSPMPRRK